MRHLLAIVLSFTSLVFGYVPVIALVACLFGAISIWTAIALGIAGWVLTLPCARAACALIEMREEAA